MLNAMIAALLAAATPAQSTSAPEVGSGDPDLAIAFINAVPDICFRAARGAVMATNPSLQKLDAVPATIAAEYGRIPTWFSLKKKPGNIFVGFGARANDCHLVLADTMQTVEVQQKLIAALRATGFSAQQDTRSKGMTDMILIRAAPDGYMLIALQGPLAPVEGGRGAQASVHVKLVSKGDFETMRGGKAPPARP